MKKVMMVISRACVYFTVAEFAILAIASIMLENQLKSDAVVGFLGLKGASLLFGAALTLSALGRVLKIKRLSAVVARVIHFALSYLCLFIVFVVIPVNFKPSFIAVFTVAFAVLYSIISLVAYGIGRLIESKKDKNADYESVYDDELKK